MTIFIGNLSFDAEQEDIIGVFSSYGEVKDCKIPLDRETGRKRGFAFVDMVNQSVNMLIEYNDTTSVSSLIEGHKISES